MAGFLARTVHSCFLPSPITCSCRHRNHQCMPGKSLVGTRKRLAVQVLGSKAMICACLALGLQVPFSVHLPVRSILCASCCAQKAHLSCRPGSLAVVDGYASTYCREQDHGPCCRQEQGCQQGCLGWLHSDDRSHTCVARSLLWKLPRLDEPGPQSHSQSHLASPKPATPGQPGRMHDGVPVRDRGRRPCPDPTL